MSTTVKLEKPKKRKAQSSIDDIFEWSKQELFKAINLFTKRKSEIVLETADRLDKAGVQKNTICMLITEKLEGYVNKDYVADVLKDHPEYKNEKQSKHGKGNKKKSGRGIPTEPTEKGKEESKEEVVQQYENNTDDAPTGKYQMPVEEYDINDVHLYDRPFLIELVRYLHNKLHNEH